MKYLLLIYGEEKALDQTEREKCYKESTQLAHDLAANRQFLGANPLRPAQQKEPRKRSGT